MLRFALILPFCGLIGSVAAAQVSSPVIVKPSATQIASGEDSKLEASSAEVILSAAGIAEASLPDRRNARPRVLRTRCPISAASSVSPTNAVRDHQGDPNHTVNTSPTQAFDEEREVSRSTEHAMSAAAIEPTSKPSSPSM